ncbi:14929_t:CDS:2 [Funneliformis geosporum]|uniref:6982_t:CDS:1 n=1 Tax=Funneliformis geosporum TaxID=1117311 RepID=A0A9W4SI67_9GLOM|nr:14929_t:CDS:2 [Funneliformis geosporum]CAI2170365.1 6982_t:CDS:2 [Funneliformis geosporum]
MSKFHQIFSKGKKRQPVNESDIGPFERESKNPRIEIHAEDGNAMVIDSIDDATTFPSPSPSSSSSSSYINNDPTQYPQHYLQTNEVSSKMKRLCLENTENNLDACQKTIEITNIVIPLASTLASDVAQNFALFAPLINLFLELGKEIIKLYEKAEHNKSLCSFLLQRCNCAVAAIKDLDIRKTEHANFFSKQENLELFRVFIKCMKRIKKFIADVSQLSKLKKYILANNIEDTFTKLVEEFEGCMSSFNFSFTIQSREELLTIKDEIRQLRSLLENINGSPNNNTKQSHDEFFKGVDAVTGKNKEFQKQNRHIDANPSDLITCIDHDEPLLDGGQYQQTGCFCSKKIEKRQSINDFQFVSFKEFSNNSSSSVLDQSQIEIRRQVNILKELKDSDHIIRFFGVAEENFKFYLVTGWMEHGNLYEYYTNQTERMTWPTKIKFALDISCGVAYLNGCQILHHDIQSANILVNNDHKVKIANFGLSKKFSEFTRNISHNIENVRYMAPEKLLIDENENNTTQGERVSNDMKRKKVPYDSKCEIYSVGALLWEIAELKKPHSDLNKSEMLVSIRKRVRDKYREPLSAEVPDIWKFLVKMAMEQEPQWRPTIFLICRTLSDLNEKYSCLMPNSPLPNLKDDEDLTIDNHPMSQTPRILSVEEAIQEHKSNNGNKQLAWQSFKHHSETNIDAKYWKGYYYFYGEIPELQQMDQQERNRIALEIFRETADKGNASAQLRYGMYLWQICNYSEAFKYLEKSAESGNSTAMYNIGSAYWNGNFVEQDKMKGANYLIEAAKKNQPKAIEMCRINKIIFI